MNTAAHAFKSDDDVQVFLHKLRHDLCNTARPLVEIPDWITQDMSDENIELPASVNEHLDMLKIYGTRLSRMIEDLLTFAHVGHSPENGSKSMTAIINDLVQDNLPDTFDLTSNIATNVIPIPTNDMTTLLDALLSNCIKHHDRDGGKINISLSKINGTYQLTICDDGPGIDAKYIDRIFEPLTTLESRDTREGSGMGLTIARHIARHYNGTIAALSPEGQRGTCIVVRFP